MIGKTLEGKYQILSLLGTGRCGQTYLAEDTQAKLKSRCVIKRFEPEAKDSLSLRKAKYLFAREAKILKILGKSDLIPRLLHHFKQGTEFYLVHEFVEGVDLTTELGDRRWDSISVSGLLVEIIEIVAVAHREKVIHQDIKPSNIIRRQADDKLVLVDFGSVKKINNQMANAQGNTSLTVPIGSDGYMAPEQKSIRPRLASDVYAVGMIGIYALTGIEPQDIALHPETEEVQWHSLIQVEPELREALDRMVTPNFARRFTSAEEALKAIRNIKLGSKLFDFKTILGAGSLLLLILGGGFYYWRLESSLSKTVEVDMFATDQTQFPFLYRDAANGLSMKYPASWQLIKSEAERGILAKLTPEADDYAIAPEVQIEVDPSDPKQTLDKYTTNAVYQITQLPQAKIIDSRPIKLAGGSGHKTLYTSLDSASNVEQKYLEVWTLKGDSRL